MSKYYDAAFAGGKSVNAMSAFDRGYYEATQGMGGPDRAATVRNHYENKLRKYLKALPADVDMSAIPAQYQGKLSEFLSNKKMEYVQAANRVDEMEVGSQQYMDTVGEMNAIKNTFTNLDKQFKLYGESKSSIIEAIEGQTTSLYGENIANVNMLRSIFNEEYEIKIDDNGNLNFVGDDGEISLNDLPDFYQKDYKTADAMMQMGSMVYQNALKTGIPLAKDGIQYFQYANKLKQLIDQSGNAGIMSILHDGLVGDIVMANDAIVSKALEGYKNGDVSFAGLRDLVVDNYMKVLIKQSLTGSSQRKVNPSQSSVGYYAPQYYNDDQGQRIMFEKHKTDSSKDKYTVLKGTEVGGGDSNNEVNKPNIVTTEKDKLTISQARQALIDSGVESPTADEIAKYISKNQ